jgi:RHS repeat-associated protein
LTVTPTVGSAITQTLSFAIASTSSPGYSASQPTSASTWPTVITPDTVLADQATVSGAQFYNTALGANCGCAVQNEAPHHEPDYRIGLVTGELQTAAHIHSYNPGVPPMHLVYSSLAADARPIFIVHFKIDPSQAVPPTVSAKLTFNGSAGQTYYWNTLLLNPGDFMQMALQADATGLSTGRYSYSIQVTANYGTPVTTTYSGSVDVINSSGSLFGSGWSFDQVERLWPVTGGVILEMPGGTSLWFANGQTAGTFVTPAGDFSTLTQNTLTNVYTRTMPNGNKIYFNSSGKQTSWADRNNNTFTDAYDGSGRLSTITDPYNLVTTLSYNGSGYVSSITDGAGRPTTLGYDASNRLTSVTDVDGAVYTYAYDGSSGRIATITNPRNYAFTVSYNNGGRVASVARPDGTSDQITALDMKALAISTPGVSIVQSALSMTNSVSFSATNAGNLLLAIWSGQGGVDGGNNGSYSPPTTPNGWTLRTSVTVGANAIYVYEKQNASSISSLSFSGESADNEGVYFAEIGGMVTSSAFDVSATSNGNGTSLSSGTTATTAQALEFAFAGFDMTGSNNSSIGAFTSPTNGFSIDKQNSASYHNSLQHWETLRLGAVYKFVTATGTQNTGVSDTNSLNWEGAIATYKASTSNTTGTQGNPFAPILGAEAQAAYTDPRNNAWQFRFDWTGFGHITQATDPLGNLANTYRDPNGLAWLTADPIGNRNRTFFDSQANPTTIVLPDDTTQQYSYNGFAEVTKYTDPNNNITTSIYDSNGNLTQVKDALNNVTTFTNNAQGFRTSQTDALNHTTTWGYDSRNRQTTQTDALGGVITMGYDSASRITTRTDQRGYTTTLAYDPAGNVINMYLPDSNPANHPTFTYLYDTAQNRTAVTDPLGNNTTTAYDALNRPTVTTDPLNHAVTVAYDGDGNTVSQTDAVHGAVTWAYDAANRQIASTNPLSQTTTLTLDADGRTSVSTDPLNLVTSLTYTSKSQVYTVTDPAGNLTTYGYSASGDTTAITSPAAGNGGGGGRFMGPGSAGGGANWTWTYDAMHRKSTGTDPLNHTVTLGYDAVSNQTTITDRLGHTWTYGYDQLNRQITVKDPLGNVTTTGYDAVGNKITQTDPLGRITTWSYDPQNRLISVKDPRGGLTTWAYDLAGRQISITDSVGNTTTYTLDAAGHKTAEQNPLGTATFAYDAANQLTSTTDKDGRRRDFTYDNVGRELTEKWINGAGQATYTATLTYNSDGWLKSEQDPYSLYSLSYDTLGRLAAIDNNGTPNAPRLYFTLTFDALGNRTGLTDNLGGTVSYSYDADSNRVWESMKVSSTQGPQVTLNYDNEQHLTSIVRTVTNGGPSVTTNYAFDVTDRLTTITHSSSQAGALATYLYSYDGASQLTQYSGPEGTLTYGYDPAGELTNVGNARLETYAYDVNGNRNYGSYTTGSANRLTADGTFTYVYDSEGNLISKTRLSDSEQWAYSWDYRNRLTQVVEKTSGGVTVTNDVFTLDIENRRIGKSVNGTQYWYGYDGQNTYADFNSSGSLTMRYLTGKDLDALYARFDGTNTGWYLTDLIGSVRQLVNTSGTVVDQLSYDSYGNILSETSSTNGDRFKYTSREWDSEIGLQFNRARYYDPRAGRWISQDPISFDSRDPDLYRYVKNAPTVFQDAVGLHYEVKRDGSIAVPGFTEETAKELDSQLVNQLKYIIQLQKQQTSRSKVCDLVKAESDLVAILNNRDRIHQMHGRPLPGEWWDLWKQAYPPAPPPTPSGYPSFSATPSWAETAKTDLRRAWYREQFMYMLLGPPEVEMRPCPFYEESSRGEPLQGGLIWQAINAFEDTPLMKR